MQDYNIVIALKERQGFEEPLPLSAQMNKATAVDLPTKPSKLS